MIRSGDYTVQEVTAKAEAYFNAHPEIDSIAPNEKASYRRWVNYWGNRSVFVNGDTVFTKMNDILSHIANLDYSIGPITGKNWALLTPDQDDYQDLGVVTSTWSDPTNPQYILAGTESSGLWKTIDGGLNWYNITDSYNGTPTYNAYYPFGVLSVAVKPSDHNTILIAASIPSFDGPYGIGILKSIDGGNTWAKTKLFSTVINSGDGIDYNPIMKIKFDPWNNNLVYASSISIIYATDDLFEHSKAILSSLGTTSPFVNPQDLSLQYSHLKLNDFEVLYTDHYINSTSGQILETNNSIYRKFVVSTYSYSNVTAQIAVGFLNYVNPQNFNCKWDNITGVITGNTSNPLSWQFIDVISLSPHFTQNENIIIDNNIYAGYILNGRFNIDVFGISQAYISNASPYNKSTATKDRNLYLDCTNSSDLNPCAGFGIYYNRFRHISDQVFVVGGYGLTLLKENLVSTTNPIGHLDYNTLNYTTFHIPSGALLPYQNENSGKNKELHLGIKDILIANHFTNKYFALTGTEGGISSFSFDDSGNPFTLNNINGKGLSIQQFNDITCTKANTNDIIVGSAMHNGYWGRNSTFSNWFNTWIDNGARLTINDYNPNYLYHLTYFPPLFANFPNTFATTNPTFMRSDNGYELDNNCSGWLCSMASQSYLYPNVNPTQDYIYQVTSIPYTFVYNLPLFVMDNEPNKLILGYHEILMSNQNGIVNPMSWANLSNFPFIGQCLGLKAIAQAGANTLYAAFERPTWSLGPNFQSGVTPSASSANKLWRINNINSGPIQIDITPNVPIPTGSSLYPFCWSNVTDILVNPDDPSEIWMAMGSFLGGGGSPNTGIDRVLHTTNSGTSWSDFSTGLSVVPVNCIRLVKDDNDPTIYTLVVGTDIGVFTRLKGATTWTRYSDGLPTVIVTDVEVWEKGRKIRAATWGRGIWEAEVPCMSSTTEYSVINNGATTTWGTDKFLDHIIITNNSTLVINSHVKFNYNGYVRVDPGSKLIIDRGELYACPTVMWKGVQVYGHNNISQNQTSQHGLVNIINNGTIRDALIAIKTIDVTNSTLGAGIINAEDANFVNNQIAISMQPYNSLINSPHLEFSYFRNCKFITNDLYHSSTYNFTEFIYLNTINKLDIVGCTFDNQTSSSIPLNTFGAFTNRGIGIMSDLSIYTINYYNNLVSGSCTPLFKNLNYGIKASSSDITKFITVKNTTFDNNCQGAYLSTINNASFTDNTFKIPDCHDPGLLGGSVNGAYGLYLDNCTGYTVENNNFDKAAFVSKAAYGLIINNSGPYNNLIYNNTFNNIYYAGTQVQGTNYFSFSVTWPPTHKYFEGGLRLKCNDYNKNYQDIILMHAPLIPFTASTIAKHQGSMSSPANNTFSLDPSINTYSDFNSFNQQITYYHHSAPSPVIPVNIYNITLHDVGFPFNKSTECLSIAATGGSTGIGNSGFNSGLLTTQIAQSTVQLNSANLILNIWRDGGNTEGLYQEIEYAYSWDTYQLFGDLINASPYLSNDVLQQTISNIDAIPDDLLTIILEANPQFQRSNNVMQDLKEIRQFSDETIEEIRFIAGDSLSPLENLEANVSHFSNERKVYVDMLKLYYLADTTGTCQDSLISLLSGEQDVSSIYELAFVYINKNDAESLNNLMYDLPLIIDHNNPDEINEWEEMKQLLPKILSMNNSHSLGDGDRSYIYMLADNENNLAGMLAKNIRLQSDTSFHYKEPIYINDSVQTRSKLNKKINKLPKKQDELTIYPNPGKNYVIIDYKNTTNAKEILLTITDMQGRLQSKQELKLKASQNFVDVHNLINGFYNFTIFVDGIQKSSKKIIIQH